MVIILEGNEGTGKSTLANHLAGVNKYPIIHRTKPKTDKEKTEMMQDYIATIGTRKNIILDRSWLSELVYGPIMRDKACITEEQSLALEQYILGHGGGMIIYCRCSAIIAWHNAQKRGEEYIKDIDTFIAINKSYDNLFMRDTHLLPVVTYDHTNNTMFEM